MSDLDPYLPAVGDGIETDDAGASADGEGWCLRLNGDRATGGRVRVEQAVDDVLLTVAVDGETTSAEASAHLDADALEALAATLLDAARHADDGADE